MLHDVLDRSGEEGGASAPTLVAALDGVLLASLELPQRSRRRFVSDSVEQLLAGLGTGPQEARTRVRRTVTDE